MPNSRRALHYGLRQYYLQAYEPSNFELRVRYGVNYADCKYALTRHRSTWIPDPRGAGVDLELCLIDLFSGTSRTLPQDAREFYIASENRLVSTRLLPALTLWMDRDSGIRKASEEISRDADLSSAGPSSENTTMNFAPTV